ncbi:MAG: hypothetical protein GF370_04685 [Candidatus Nealsonbacteria bacterium]|nr:hypothetical protein [Candidatus Nealsonbacteria bacterium]
MTTKDKTNIAAIAFLVLGGLVIFFLVIPVFNNIQGHAQQLEEKEDRITLLESKIQNIEDFKRSSEQINQGLEKANALFINSKAPTGFISFLEEAAQSSNVSLDISPSVPEERGGDEWPSIIFRLSSTGNFPDFYRFLEKIESSPYLVKINSLRIGKTRESSRESDAGAYSSEIEASLELKVFCDRAYEEN